MPRLKIVPTSAPLSTQRDEHSFDYGDWIDEPFDAADYTASGAQTWTVESGEVVQNRYMMIGPNTMLWQFNIANTDVGGTPDNELRIAVPGGRTISSVTSAVAALQIDNGTNGIARAVATAGNAFLQLFLAAAGNWAASSAMTNVAGQIVVELVPE